QQRAQVLARRHEFVGAEVLDGLAVRLDQGDIDKAVKGGAGQQADSPARFHGEPQGWLMRSPAARRSAKMTLSKGRVGWTRLVSSVQARRRAKSIHRPVPVKPVWPMVSPEHSSPPDQPS